MSRHSQIAALYTFRCPSSCHLSFWIWLAPSRHAAATLTSHRCVAVQIGFDNAGSIALFQRKLGFTEVRNSNL